MKKIVIIASLFLFTPVFVFAGDLSAKLSGKILLQVEGRGEAWYVSPRDNNKHYMGTPEDAFRIMKEQGYGITNNNLWKIEIGKDSFLGDDLDGDGLSDEFEVSIGSSVANKDTDNDGIDDKTEIENYYKPSGNTKIIIDKNFAEKQKGKILLQVEGRGEAWYINPDDGKRYFLAKPQNAFEVVRKFGLGVKNSDLDSIPGLEQVKVPDNLGNSIEIAKEKISNFINNVLLSSGSALIEKVEEEYGLYKFTVKINNGDSIVSYATKDAKFFFPQVMDVDEMTNKSGDKFDNTVNDDSGNTTGTKVDNEYKTNKPNVELFVMSHCPFGTQMEKGIIPVLKLLDDKIDFDLRFTDYAMHGEKEIYEELNQFCIRENENDKLIDYLECFLADGDGNACLEKTKINLTTLNECVSKTDSEFGVTEKLEDKSTWLSGRYPKFYVDKEKCDEYGVQGSPTLIINGDKVSSGRSPQALLSTVCQYFIDMPEECSESISSETPSSGFGYSVSNTSGSGSCN